MIILSFKKCFPVMLKIMHTIRASSTGLENVQSPPLQHTLVGKMMASQASLARKEADET
jgi:hypothetical protein